MGKIIKVFFAMRLVFSEWPIIIRKHVGGPLKESSYLLFISNIGSEEGRYSTLYLPGIPKTGIL